MWVDSGFVSRHVTEYTWYNALSDIEPLSHSSLPIQVVAHVQVMTEITFRKFGKIEENVIPFNVEVKIDSKTDPTNLDYPFVSN